MAAVSIVRPAERADLPSRLRDSAQADGPQRKVARTATSTTASNQREGCGIAQRGEPGLNHRIAGRANRCVRRRCEAAAQVPESPRTRSARFSGGAASGCCLMLTWMNRQMGSDHSKRQGDETPYSTQSVVDTACPLDCPDSCSLAVTVSKGRVVDIDGSTLNAPTAGYICAKVRNFGERVYGEARLQYPAVRIGTEGAGTLLARRAGTKRSSSSPRACSRCATLGRRSDSAVFVRRIERAADAGHARRRAVPPVRHLAPRAHGVRGADRRRRAGALRQDAVGHLRGLSGRQADHPLGRQPVDVGHSSRAVRARGAETGRAARRHRSARDAARAAGRSPPGAEARHRRRDRACDPSASIRRRIRRRALPCRAHEGRRSASRACGRRGRFERAAETSGRAGSRAASGWQTTTRARRRR